MLASLSLVFLFGLAASAACRRLRLPPIVGMLAVGVLLGPCALDLLDPSILGISADLREMALIIILIKAGLSLRPDELRRVGRPALLMSFLPALFEVAAFALIAPCLLPVSRLEAALMGSVLGAVSPAVVVPRMVRMIEEGFGRSRGIPQLILAGASLDDVFVIVLFGSLLGAAQGTGASAGDFAGIPVSIVLGALAGAAVDIRYTLAAGPGALGMIAVALAFRSAGVLLSLAGSGLSLRERLFCVIAYLPKATVQAAIGGVPLAAGLPCGQLVLSVAVLSIVVTAPLGAWGIDAACQPLVGRD